MKSCFFIGHHDTEPELYPILLAEVERHVREYNVTEFYVGRYGRFDSMAAKAVIETQKRESSVRLMMVLPYHPAIRPIEKLDGFDSTYYPWEGERIPGRLAIVKTNQRMVDICDYLIANAWHHLGGAGRIVEYARKQEEKCRIHVTNLAQRAGVI